MLLNFEELLGLYKRKLGYPTSLDDQERYLKMSMKIDSSDPDVLQRNQYYNDLLMLRISKCFSKSLDILFKLCTTLISKANKCGQDKKRLWIHCLFPKSYE